MSKLHVKVKPMAATRTELSVQLRGGRLREATHDSGIPERDLLKQGERLAHKFERVAPLSAAQSRAVRACVAELDQLADVRELERLVLDGA
jgi:hypothetical protein